MKARKNPGKSSDGYGKNMGDIKNNETPFNDEVGLLLQETTSPSTLITSFVCLLWTRLLPIFT